MITKEEFIKLYNQYHGDDIECINQIQPIQFSGDTLYHFIDDIMELKAINESPLIVKSIEGKELEEFKKQWENSSNMIAFNESMKKVKEDSIRMQLASEQEAGNTMLGGLDNPDVILR